jgi:acetyltransferase-like isoleucine patch superfamily enzyme
MIDSVKRAVSIARRHSGLVNLVRNLIHLMHGRRVSPGAWLIADGALCLGHHATVSSGCRLTIPAGGSLELGDHVWLNRDVEIDVLGRVVVGAHTTVQRRCSLIGDVEIGRGCVFAPNVFISSGRHYFDEWPAVPIQVQDARAGGDAALLAGRSRPVRIGDDCWLGINVVVQPGVTVGRGVVIGANSVVVQDVPPYTVVGGVPARRLRLRLDFVAPRELDGMREAQLPYFYSGFEYGHARPPVADGDFVLALSLRQARAVRLALRGVSAVPVKITSGSVCGIVPPNETVELEVPVDSTQENDELQVSLPAGGRVAVLSAFVLTTGGWK